MYAYVPLYICLHIGYTYILLYTLYQTPRPPRPRRLILVFVVAWRSWSMPLCVCLPVSVFVTTCRDLLIIANSNKINGAAQEP